MYHYILEQIQSSVLNRILNRADSFISNTILVISAHEPTVSDQYSVLNATNVYLVDHKSNICLDLPSTFVDHKSNLCLDQPSNNFCKEYYQSFSRFCF